MFKGLDKFIGGCPIQWITNLLCLLAIMPPTVNHQLAMFTGYWSSASRDIDYLKWHVTS